MSQYFPKFKDKAGYPTDYESINHNFRQVVNEVEGNLGEHNWAENAITATADVANDAALRIYPIAQAVDHGIADTSAVATSPTNSVKISTNREWTTIHSKTITCDASLLWAMASFQVNYLGLTNVEASFQFCLMWDGVSIPETVTGCLDRSNDRKGEGLYESAHGLSIDMIIPVTPGQHTFALKGRLVADEDYTTFDSSTKSCEIFARELILVEMR